MTNHIKIEGIPPRIQYTADGQNAVFEFPFAIFKPDNLQVYCGNELQTKTQYTVEMSTDTTGGSVTFHSVPANGTIVTLIRNLRIERTTDFQEGGALRANTLNDELDYQIACQQQIADSLNRSMVLPPYAVNVDVDLTLPLPEAGKAIVWNSEGTNLENSTVSVNALESTLNGYKQAAENASATAVEKSEIASNAAETATQKSTEAATAATTAVNAMASKANTDMDNLTDTGKEMITALGMPDLTAGVSKDISSSHRAIKDSFIIATGGSATSNGTGCILEVSIDNTNFFAIYSCSGSGLNTLNGTMSAYIPKGYYYRLNSAVKTSLTEYPLKGV